MAPSPQSDRRELWQGMDGSWAMTVELLTATCVWGGIGWLLDAYAFDSRPWGMLGGSVLGFVLGMYLLYLRMQRDGQRDDERRRANRSL